MSSTHYAIALTVRDEWDMLRYVLPYYAQQGASRVFLYFDETADAALTEAASFHFVHARSCVDISEISAPTDWIKSLEPAVKMDHRKRINTIHAAEQARQAGIEWIISLDPDEIVLPAEEEVDLAEMLGEVPSDIDQVLVPNLELLPMAKIAGDNPYATQTLFLRRQDRVALLWRYANVGLRRWLSPHSLARLENTLYRVANLGVFPPVLRNPLNNSPIYRSLFLGYNNSKAFMRTSVAQEHNFNIHKWQSVGRPLKSVTAGRLLHYDLPSYDYFVKKFRQRPANMQIAAFDTRFQIGEIARNAPAEMAQHFYETVLCCPDDEEAKRLIDAGIAIQIDEVAKAFARKDSSQ